MSSEKFWGMRVQSHRKEDGVIVKKIVGGEFAVYQVSNGEEFYQGIIEIPLWEQKPWESMKNLLKATFSIRTVDISITPQVKYALSKSK